MTGTDVTMCGRTCLTLEPNEVICACRYKLLTKPKAASGGQTQSNASPKEEEECKVAETASNDGGYVTPEWRSEFNCGRKYEPSYNLAPTDITPVLVSSDYFGEADTEIEAHTQSRVVVPMMWGMIPFWHKGDYRRHGLTTHNCRLEHMLESKLYRGPFRRGQRCVVLCEGFYEWQTTKSAKPSERAPHLLYMPQPDGIKIYDKSTWTPDNVKLLKFAGLFDVWEDENGDKIFSYSVITFESSKLLSWLHHRMPAILETEEQVNDWLDFKRVSDEKALATLRPAQQLEWHRVSTLVNNSRNKLEQCNKPIELVHAANATGGTTYKTKTLLSWLNVRKRREEQMNQLSDDESTGGSGGGATTTSESDGENPPKRPRFRDFKRAVREAAQLNVASTDSASEKPQTCDES